jgi:branched-chain amino acid transport system substrate-binding protein
MKPLRSLDFRIVLLSVAGCALLIYVGVIAIFPPALLSTFTRHAFERTFQTIRWPIKTENSPEVPAESLSARSASPTYPTYPFGVIESSRWRRVGESRVDTSSSETNDSVAGSEASSSRSSSLQIEPSDDGSTRHDGAATAATTAIMAAESARSGASSAQFTTGDPSNPAVQGISDNEIRFGIVAPFSGSAKELGRQMKLGIETVFNLVNDSGGVHGRKLKLFSADDGYEPSRTGDAMKRLLETEHIFGIVGNVGTPTAAVALPIALEHKMLFFGAFTGANLLRAIPPDRYVFNYRASYAEETEAAVRYLVRVRGVKPREIAVFAQQDAYGDAGFEGVARAIRGLTSGYTEPVLRLNYARNSVDVEGAVSQLRARKSQTRAIVMVATYRAAAKFIEMTRDRYPNMIYTNVSFVGSTALAEELMLEGAWFADGVIVTQVVPAVTGYSTAVLEYKAALTKFFPGETPDYVSFEGYVVAKILVEALRRAGPQLDTEKLIETLEGMHDLDLGLGTLLSFARSEHQASHKVWGTQIDAAGHFKAIGLD